MKIVTAVLLSASRPFPIYLFFVYLLVVSVFVKKKPLFPPERFESSAEDRACLAWIMAALGKDPERRLTNAEV